MSVNRKKIIKWILVSILLVAITGGIVAYQMYNKPHRNVAAAKAETITAVIIATAYEANEKNADSVYLNKILEVSGEVTDILKNQKGETVIALKGTDMSGVSCTMEGTVPTSVNKGLVITVKGICTGYLADVVLVRCVYKEK